MVSCRRFICFGMRSLAVLLILAALAGPCTARHRRSEACREKLHPNADMVFTGTVEKVYRSRSETYRGVVKVKRVVRGNSNFADNTVIVEGFGDSRICHSDVRDRDTRIFFVSETDSGHLRLNSSVLRVTVTNLDRAVSAVTGHPPQERKIVVESECERMYCAYGALCVVDKRTQQAHCRCQETCADVFAPVCGSDGVTYSSDCQLRMASCSKQKRIFTKHQGPCDLRDPCEDKDCHFGAECQPSLDGRSAECLCPAQCATYGESSRSRPVCGTDGKDYPNVCEMRRTSCLDMRPIDVRYKGHCDPCQFVQCPPYQVCQLDENRNPTCRCNDVCAPDFRTVCGSDGKTYANECMLRTEACKTQRNVRVIYSGDCSTGSNPCDLIKCGPGQECDIDKFGVASCQCPPSCEPRMQPVCGSNGRTYDNECELRRQSCLLRQELTAVHEGECGEHGPCHTHHCSYGAVCVMKGGQPACECPTCAEEFEPVCGTDGISYMNACKLKREACEQKADILAEHDGLCNTCHTQECDFYAVCESFGDSLTRCVCPEVCIKVDAPVCGTDGISYANECELRVEACKKQQYIAVATKGQCEQCEHVHCKHGARCESGRCVCPTDCPEAFEFVCSSDGRTHKNECEMRRAGCHKGRDLAVQFYGACEEIAEATGDDEEEQPALKERKISSCQDKQCKFGGVCDFNSEGDPFCVCTFHCPAIKEPVCGSDGRMYDNECRMREESCLVQKRIEITNREVCVDHVDIACDGEPPVVDPTTDKDYYCGKGPGSKLCPAKTVCHLTQYFAKCCNVAPLIKTCEDTPFGCCPDGRHHVLGPNNGGCPSVCNCNRLGSYSSTCDPVSRQCPCKPGVGGLRCDRCEPGYWGLHKISSGNSGCAHCNCHPYGSVRDDCEQATGRCVCRHGVQGMKCDACPPGSVLRPEGCMDESQVNTTAASCAGFECFYGARCVEKEGLPRCSCDFRCAPEDSRDPVCGLDGNTYGSECQMRMFACRLQKAIGIRYYGGCRKDGGEPETTVVPPRLPKRRSHHPKKQDVKSTRAVARHLPQNLFLGPRPPTPYSNMTTTAIPILAFPPDPEVPVEIPSFSGKSYIELYKLEAYSRLSLEVEFKTFSNDGILLYNGQTSSRSGDFVSLSVKDGFIEFRYNLGNGVVVIKSPQKIILGKYHKIVARRYLKDGMLAIDGQETVSGKSLGTLNYLDLVENLYVGYVPGASKVVFLNIGVESGLIGCIRRLKIEKKDVNLKMPSSKEILKSSGIGECTLNACSNMPCKNGGTCIASDSKRYECRCTEGFQGETCEKTSDPCSSGPCAEGSTCALMPDGNFTCKCVDGRSGRLCDRPKKETYIPDFRNNSFLELATLQNVKHAFSMEIWFLSRSGDGVLLYNGQLLNRRGDFVAVNLVKRHVHFVYNLGSGSTSIMSRHPVTLNEWHAVKISRLRRQGTLKVDNETTVIGKSKPPLAELNLSLPLYLGGVPDLRHVHKDSGVITGLDGAVQRLVVNGNQWHSLTARAIRAHGVRKYRGYPCAEDTCLHGGECIPELNSFTCRCPAKFVGKRCDKRIRKKDFRQAIFFNETTQLSFRYKTFKGSRSRKSNRFQVRFRTLHEDGLLFWTSKGSSGDYLALALVGGFPELSFNLGGKQGERPRFIRSSRRVDDGAWHTLTAIRKKTLGEIRVDKVHVVTNVSEAGATDLNTDGLLWIGGAPNIPKHLPLSYHQGFTGCVHSIVIDKSPLHHLLSGRETMEFCHTSKRGAS